MSDRISLKDQNNPAKLRSEYEEAEATDPWAGVLTPPGFPPLPNERNGFFSQPSSSSSSDGSAQLNTTFPVLSAVGASANGASVFLNFAQPWHHHVTGQTCPCVCPCHMTQQLPIAFLPPPTHYQFSAMPLSISQGTLMHAIRSQPISGVPASATDRDTTTPQTVNSSTHYQSSPMPRSISGGTPRRVQRLSTLKRAIRTRSISCVPAGETDRHATTPQPVPSSTRYPVSPMPAPSIPGGTSHGVRTSQVADDHSLPQPQATHETNAQYAATGQSWPQVTVRRSDPNKKMTPKEAYMYAYCSMEWEITESERKNGKYKGKTEYFYYNHMINRQFRSLKSVEEYIRTNKIPATRKKRK